MWLNSVLLRFCRSILVRSLGSRGSVLRLTKSRVQHVKGHAVALFRSRNRHEPLVAIVLGLVNLNDAAAHLPYLIDLLSSLANDGADHVVGDVDLLRDGASWHAGMHGLALGSAVRLGAGMGSHMWLNVRSSCSVCRRLTCSVLHGNRWSTVRGTVGVWLGVGGRRHVMGSTLLVSAVVLCTSVMSRCRLGAVWNHLHASGDGTNGCTTPGGIC